MDWYSIWIFNFFSSFLNLNILFSFVIHKREDEGDWTKVTFLVVNLPIIVNFIKPPEKANILLGGLHTIVTRLGLFVQVKFWNSLLTD